MSKYLTEWLDYIESMVGRGVYVWGAQGQTVASIGGASKVKSWITRMYASQGGSASSRAANAAKAYKFYQQLAAKIGVENIVFFDCSGLGMHYIQNLKGLYSDTTAAGMYYLCTKIAKADLKPGDMVFKKGSSGSINHIGYVARNGQIIEAQESGSGVIKRKLSATNWTLYGRIKWFKAEIEGGADDGSSGTSLTETGVSMRRPTLKRGSKGADVKTLQNLLIAKAYKLPKYGADGDFGTETETAVMAFQRYNGLEVDGVVGPKTWAALLDTATPDAGTVIDNPYKEPTVNLTKGAKGDGVRWIQWALIRAGYSCGSHGIDGDFGSATLAAVKAFQKAKGLEVDGIVGTKTRAALKG